jgi:Flp pilus assembly protein TadD
MQHALIGHGCPVLLLFAAAAYAGVDQPIRVNTRVFDIEYEVNEASLPLDAVQLWYTQGDGKTWHPYGFDDDRQSPISFEAPAEGLYGFYLIMTNATGPSSGPPSGSTEPHCRAFVDHTPPVVQLHPVRQITLLGQRALQIRWTAIDRHLKARPIEIAYRRPPADTWSPVVPEPVANTGQYDWRLPPELTGPLAIRVSVEDDGGHVIRSEEQVIEPVSARSDAASALGDPTTTSADKASGERAVSALARERARQLLEEGLAYRDRAQFHAGITRLREAIRLNPELTEAFAEMGGMFYRIGDYDGAAGAFEIALKQQPGMRAALRGAAMVDRQKGDYASAAARLRAVLRHHPDDAEVWMNLGDIAIFRGDEILARKCYTRATEVDPEATQIIKDARERLTVMAKVSRTYR